jgi:spermidine synthase
MKMKKDKYFYGLVGLFFIVLFLSPSYDFKNLNRGIYFGQGDVVFRDFKNFAEKKEILFAEEGLYGSVLVDTEEDPNSKHSFFGYLQTLKINGKTQCGTGRGDTVTTSLAGGLPVILGKEGDALNIGLGCGLTLGMLEKGGFNLIDSIEVDPVVADAARFFSEAHNNALDDPRSNIIIDDARNYLLKTDKKYDVIVNEPSHPYTISNSNIMTREFFLMMKEHLKDDGLVVQWVPAQQLDSCERSGSAIIYKTFASVFPYNYVFVSYPTSIPSKKFSGEITMIGSLIPIEIENYLKELDGNSKIETHFKKIGINNIGNHFIFSNEDVLGFTEDVVLNTDNKPVLEFLASKNLYSKQEDCEIKQVIKFKEDKI